MGYLCPACKSPEQCGRVNRYSCGSTYEDGRPKKIKLQSKNCMRIELAFLKNALTELQVRNRELSAELRGIYHDKNSSSESVKTDSVD